MKPTLYNFNYSQDIVHLQTKFSLFQRVSNIIFSITFEEGFEDNIMYQAIQLLIERNDCLRLKTIKEGKEIKQYFEKERNIEEIPSIKFRSAKEMDHFFKRFRKGAIKLSKGETAKFVFATNPSGEKMLIVKISHFVADTYGIGILINDLYAIYKALTNNSELPAAPGKFEDLIKNDTAYRSNDFATTKDREFFKEYYEKRHPQHPEYCGIHGERSDRWRKLKAKGKFALPYFFVKCDTEGYRFVIPSAITEKAAKWCEEQSISMNTFFFYTCAIACSLLNDKAPYQLPLELLNCRATVADKKAAGTKVQSLSVYTTVDYKKTFNENIAEISADQNELYRHTKLTYLEIQDIEHKLWNYSMLSQITNFCFSFIPFDTPQGLQLQVHSNGKGALAAYIALMLNIKTNEIYVNYDVQTMMCSAKDLIEFQNTYINVIEIVLKNQNTPLDNLF